MEILPLEHKQHKLTQIKTIPNTYPQLPFILIGDSGQEDPEIYQQVVRSYPGRILAMYIRAVTTKERDNQVKMIIEMLRGGGVEMVLVPDTFAAAQHAVEKGFFTQESLSYILEEKIKDESKPDPIERLV